jgi:hypothetical protein
MKDELKKRAAGVAGSAEGGGRKDLRFQIGAGLESPQDTGMSWRTNDNSQVAAAERTERLARE